MKKELRPRTFMALIIALGIIALLLLHLFLAPGTLAQSGGPYELSWSTVDGGGDTFSTGGGHSLGGTAGQPDAGLLTGGPYTLGGGFWGGGAVAAFDYQTYLPLVLK